MQYHTDPLKNIGYNAHILSQRTFTMFVVMALVTTFTTTPLVTWLYPPWYQQKLESWRRGDIDWDGHPLAEEKTDAERTASEIGKLTEVHRMAVHLRLDTLPGVLALVALFARRTEAEVEVKVHPSKRTADASKPSSTKRPFQVQGIRLKEIGDRESSIMRVSNLEEEAQTDPILSTFRITLGQIVHVAVQGIVLQCLPESYASEFLDCVNDTQVDMLLLSWSLSGNMSENEVGPVAPASERFGNLPFNQFISKVLNRPRNHKTAIFIDNGFGGQKSSAAPGLTRKLTTMSLRETTSRSGPSIPLQDQGHHLFLPFFGTSDDIAALHLVLQLVRDPSVTATVVYCRFEDVITTIDPQNAPQMPEKHSSTNVLATASHTATIFQSIQETLPEGLSERILFESISISSESSIEPVLAKARLEVGQNPKNAGDLVVLGRNTNDSILQIGNSGYGNSDVSKTLGTTTGAFLAASERISASFLIIGATEGKVENA